MLYELTSPIGLSKFRRVHMRGEEAFCLEVKNYIETKYPFVELSVDMIESDKVFEGRIE